MNSLRSHIYCGFAVIVTLLVAVGVFGYSGVSRLNSSSMAMRRVTDLDAAVGLIDQDVAELQLRVARYMETGNASIQEDIFRLTDSLMTRIADSSRTADDVRMRSLFDRMSSRVAEYRNSVESVVTERSLRADLVQQQMPQQTETIQNLLMSLLNNLGPEDEQADSRQRVLLCKSHFLQAERQLLRYYDSEDGVFVNDGLKQIDLAIQKLQDTSGFQPLTGQRDRILDELRKYRQISVRSVQATRGYLYLVNVVLAGGASEMNFFSDQLRELSSQQSLSLAEDMATTTSSVRRYTGIGVAIAIILGASIATRLGALILQPITSLKETFAKLADGRTVVEISESHRRDEIGEMAQAAEVFRQRNLQQRELLKQTQFMADQLTVKAAELEATNADLDSFVYVASHDLKSPLRGIRQLSAWIEEDAGHLLPEESNRHLQAMQSRVQRMESLLDDLLQFSRIGREDCQPEMVDMNELLQNVLELTDNPKNIRIQVPDRLPVFSTMRVPLEQVLLNLIGNAVKYNDKHENGFVEIVCEKGDDCFRFHVRDNGPGIAPRHHERVFKMYQRVGDLEVDGSGMGLAIVKKQVERLRGTIDLQSNPDAGVTFTVVWPTTAA